MSIDLGKDSGSLCSPPSTVSSQQKNTKFYPSLYLENIENLPSIPESGSMLVRFKRRSISATKRDDGGSSVTVTIDVVSLEKITGEKSARRSSVDAFDAVSKEVFSDLDEE